ncbi:MauE/DoxX family redox-associated membrane protein [Micromonospora sp. DT31]|uniref:MauE/DoxX family redox-associated membrane protein n=1 Tax=Micromonospora sp. DT31 TaxID=3393434 RepID=UPI003CECC7B9
MSLPLLGIRSLLATVFLLAAVGKLRSRRHHRDFRRALDGYAFLPARSRAAVAVALPVAELVVAGLLVVPRSARPGLLAATVLLTCLTAGTAWAVTHGQAVRCACFGPLVLGRLASDHVAGGPLVGLALGLATAGVGIATLPRLTRYVEENRDREAAVAAQSRLHTALNRMTGLRELENPDFRDRLHAHPFPARREHRIGDHDSRPFVFHRPSRALPEDRHQHLRGGLDEKDTQRAGGPPARHDGPDGQREG